MTAKFRSKSIARLQVVGVTVLGVALYAQDKPQPAPPPAVAPAAAASAAAGVVPVPPDYVIGSEDVLSIVYWRDKDMSADVAVRPDGKISLALVNDVQAAGLTPAQLRDKLVEASKKYIEDPNITVVVKNMNSRKVFITGEVEKPGTYPLISSMSVLQLISMAGGLREYADAKKILIVRTENGKQVSYKFNYKDVTAGKNLPQNIELKLGDTVIVP